MMRSIIPIVLITTSMLMMPDAQAQEVQTPRKEFVIVADMPAVEVSRGASSRFSVAILRSKSYRKTIAKLAMTSGVPDGMTVMYDPQEGVMDKSVIELVATEKTVPGEYNVILNCTLNYKTKGVVIKVKVI